MNELDKIINGGYCIGCGACAAATHGRIEIVEDEFLQYQAKLPAAIESDDLASALSACPFSNSGLNEDEISEKVFDQENGHVGDVIGYYRSLYAGHVTNDGWRDKVTSGGIITWTLTQLLERGLVDGVIHVKRCSRPGTLFEYGVSRTADEVLAGAKSRYYPVEISKVMDFVHETEGRYVFVGLPCFNKAVRNLCLHDPVLNERIVFFVGLVCGHLKSKAYAEMLAWRAGIDPKRLAQVDFRWKLPDRPSDQYGIRVEDVEGNSKVLVARETSGTNWGLGFFKYEACDYCDDIFSETADIAVGDAWLKQYTADSKGNSVVVVRSREMQQIINDGLAQGALQLDVLTAEEALMSQGGGFRHRRTGLGDRLFLKQKRAEWVPEKRVDPVTNGIPVMRKLVYRYRMFLREQSA
ncbi:MAG: coenzyme F420 hydrogenase, partial [Lentisphaerae bacterium]|nr:coenzyme F420 hydrogenase [Lentisphaerota bacterium]